MKYLKQINTLMLCLVLVANFSLVGCGKSVKTDGPITEVEQKELDDQLAMIEQKIN